MKTWWTQYRRSRQLDEAPAPSAGRRAASEAPAAVLAPLEREMALFESDLRQAAQLAMASLP